MDGLSLHCLGEQGLGEAGWDNELEGQGADHLQQPTDGKWQAVADECENDQKKHK